MMDMQIVVHKYPEANVIYMQGSYYIQKDNKPPDNYSILLGMGNTPEEAWKEAARGLQPLPTDRKTWTTNNEL
jgi:hypothetical protein